MRRRVTYVKLQGADTFLPGFGGLGSTLPPTNKTISGLNMYYDSETPTLLIIEIKGKEYFVPLANVQTGVFDHQLDPAPKLAVVK